MERSAEQMKQRAGFRGMEIGLCWRSIWNGPEEYMDAGNGWICEIKRWIWDDPQHRICEARCGWNDIGFNEEQTRSKQAETVAEQMEEGAETWREISWHCNQRLAVDFDAVGTYWIRCRSR